MKRFSKPLLRLPINFSADRLAEEVRALPESAWVGHPMRFNGNTAVRLITEGGQPTDIIEGEMAPTEYLLACPYVMQAMAAIGCVWGRSRFMGLAAGAEVPVHIDSHYYWRTHIRIHIPVITNPGVSFTCGGETVHMAPGECWVFDSFRKHEVHNRGTEKRVHLVLDTVGGGRIHDLIDAAEAGANAAESPILEPRDGAPTALTFERVNVPVIMSPWEIRCHADFILGGATPGPALDRVRKRIDRFGDDWAALWARFGEDERAAGAYVPLLVQAQRDLAGLGANAILLGNGVSVLHMFERLIAEAAVKATRRRPGQQSASPALDKAL
ncbi:MAG: aspartyl/asparaginyl beta-hydroxylase domain-containing protein [Sphingomicrobium sp.]